MRSIALAIALGAASLVAACHNPPDHIEPPAGNLQTNNFVDDCPDGRSTRPGEPCR